MPVYEYECPKCGEKDEMVGTYDYVSKQKWICRVCNTVMKMVIGKVATVLKGDGWAKDGYSKVNKGSK